MITLDLGAIVGAVVAFIGLVAWAARLQGQANGAQTAADLAQATAAAAVRELAEFKVTAAREFLTAGALDQLETRITKHLDRIYAVLDRLAEGAPRPRASRGAPT